MEAPKCKVCGVAEWRHVCRRVSRAELKAIAAGEKKPATPLPKKPAKKAKSKKRA